MKSRIANQLRADAERILNLPRENRNHSGADQSQTALNELIEAQKAFFFLFS